MRKSTKVNLNPPDNNLLRMKHSGLIKLALESADVQGSLIQLCHTHIKEILKLVNEVYELNKTISHLVPLGLTSVEVTRLVREHAKLKEEVTQLLHQPSTELLKLRYDKLPTGGNDLRSIVIYNSERNAINGKKKKEPRRS